MPSNLRAPTPRPAVQQRWGGYQNSNFVGFTFFVHALQSIDLSTFDKPAEVELAKSAQKGEGDASRSAARSRGLSSISGVASGVVDAAGVLAGGVAGVLAGGVAGGVSATADAVTSAVGKLPDVTDALTLLPFRPSRRGP